MALNFPNSPTIGDEFTGGGFTWTWTGSAWEKVSAASSATGRNFTLSVGASGNTTYTFSNSLAAGTYTITSQLGDTTFDIYLITSDNQNAGYANTGSLTATADFNRVVVYGATPNDVFSFTYVLSASPTTTGDVVDGAAPFLSSATPVTLESINDTTTVQGGNFATDVTVAFRGTDSVDRAAKSIVRSSSTQLIVTRPDIFPVSAEPFSMIATNPGITNPSTNVNRLSNYFDAGGGITWVTGTTLPEYLPSTAYSTTVSATDADGQAVTYSITSGTLPTGLSLNSSTGVISGTPSASGSQTFTIRATDSGSNTADRTFTMGQTLIAATGGTITTSGNHRFHTFNSSGTFTVTSNPLNTSIDYLVVAGGGGTQGFNASSGDASSGGGGAGGYRTGTMTPSATNYTITIGAGGSGVQGSNSSAFGITSTGGGFGGSGGNGGNNGSSGGNGGSGGGTGTYSGGNPAGTGIAGQGNNGGTSGSRSIAGAGGGAGAAASGGTAGVGLQWLNGVFYAGGGGAGGGGTGGNGGGGNGGGGVQNAGQVVYGGGGGQNTGGGSGGTDAAFAAADSNSGGSGIVIVRYALS